MPQWRGLYPSTERGDNSCLCYEGGSAAETLFIKERGAAVATAGVANPGCYLACHFDDHVQPELSARPLG